jgi:tetratricopeptide (TPR) repeat protein
MNMKAVAAGVVACIVLTSCSSASEVSMSVADQLRVDGVEMIESGRWEEAHSTYTQIIDEYAPTDRNALGRAYLNRAIALWNLGRVEEALADEAVVIELAPSDIDLLAQAYLNRSREHSQLDMRDEAVSDATAVIELQPDNTDYLARAHVNRGISMRELGRFDDAVADWTAALHVDPEPDVRVAALVYRSELYVGVLSRYDEAVKDATAVIDANSAASGELIGGTRQTTNALLARAFIVRGASLGELGESDDALDDLAKAITFLPKNNPHLAKAHLVRAVLLRQLHREAEAVTDLERVTVLVGPDNSMHRAAEEMLVALGEPG